MKHKNNINSMTDPEYKDFCCDMRDIARGFNYKKHCKDAGEQSVPGKPQYSREGDIFKCPFCDKFSTSSHAFLHYTYFLTAIDNHIGTAHPDWKELENSLKVRIQGLIEAHKKIIEVNISKSDYAEALKNTSFVEALELVLQMIEYDENPELDKVECSDKKDWDVYDRLAHGGR